MRRRRVMHAPAATAVDCPPKGFAARSNEQPTSISTSSRARMCHRLPTCAVRRPVIGTSRVDARPSRLRSRRDAGRPGRHSASGAGAPRGARAARSGRRRPSRLRRADRHAAAGRAGARPAQRGGRHLGSHPAGAVRLGAAAHSADPRGGGYPERRGRDPRRHRAASAVDGGRAGGDDGRRHSGALPHPEPRRA